MATLLLGVGCYLEGAGNLVSRLIKRIAGVIIWLVGVRSILTNPPSQDVGGKSGGRTCSHQDTIGYDLRFGDALPVNRCHNVLNASQ